MPINLKAEEMIRLDNMVSMEMIEKTITVFIQTQQNELSQLYNSDFRMEFEKDAKDFLMAKYATTEVPKRVQNGTEFPYFFEVVILDLQKVMWKAYRIAVKRKYQSYLEFLRALKDRILHRLNITLDDVQQSLEFWDCNAMPQPPPPKCPSDCVENTYRRAVEVNSR